METFEKSQRLTLVAGLGVVSIYLGYLIFVYWMTESYPAPHLDRLYVYILSFVIITFVLRENRRSRVIGFAHDLGFFAYLTLPIFIPYYLIKSRRIKGVLVVLGLAGLFLLDPLVFLIWSSIP